MSVEKGMHISKTIKETAFSMNCVVHIKYYSVDLSYVDYSHLLGGTRCIASIASFSVFNTHTSVRTHAFRLSNHNDWLLRVYYIWRYQNACLQQRVEANMSP